MPHDQEYEAPALQDTAETAKPKRTRAGRHGSPKHLEAVLADAVSKAAVYDTPEQRAKIARMYIEDGGYTIVPKQ
jgi:hypothetical protein